MKKTYWELLAQKNKKIKTSPDIGCDILERAFIKKYLKKRQNVLDIGSGDGIATIEFAKMVNHLEALEISPTLIKIAQKRAQKAKINNITWNKGSVLDLNSTFKKNFFDVFISKRALINILSWPEQKEAISQVAIMAKRGDLFLLTEGFIDALKNLQNLRKKFGLKEDKIVKFNLWFERAKFESFVKKYFEIIEQNNLGIYYFLSHFYYPLYIKPFEPKYRSKMNRVATEIALKLKALEEFGYINFYALRKK